MARPVCRFGIIAAASVATSFPAPAHAGPASSKSAEAALPWQSFVDEAASRFSVPASWIRAVIRIESNGNPKAVSPKGAVGLMQLMPDTFTELRVRCGLGADPTDPHDNIIAGTAYLRDM
ncbi:MAG: lytic transglycosylase domain-containing protein, partial [Hyphomicrobiales bacterium]|nr:lytic transglycosylase domain-containing protein [Hyphomicrobiales bacterium]